MKTLLFSILAVSVLSFGANAQSSAPSPELKNLEAEAAQHKTDQKDKTAQAYKAYRAAKAAAAAAYKAANQQAEKDFKKAKETIAAEDRDFKVKYKEIKVGLKQSAVAVKKAVVQAEEVKKEEVKAEEPKKEEPKK